MSYHEKLEQILVFAGDLALSLRKDGLHVEYKEDNSPVTNADHAVSDFLIAALQAAFPGDAFLSEEHPDTTGIAANRFWVIDPIDGTKHYVAGKDHWCIMLCLVEKTPVYSIIYYPELDIWYYAEKEKGAYRKVHGVEKQLRIRSPTVPALIHYSKSSPVHIGEESSRGTVKHLLALARGELDCFIQSEREYWDVWPPGLILQEAGGVIVDTKGKPLRVTPDQHFHQDFIAGHPAVVKLVVNQIKKRL